MINRILATRPGSDCTAPYYILLDREYTVGEFIEAVLKQEPREWGKFCIYNKMYFFGNPRCGYRDGKLIDCFTDDILKKKVVKVEASGGWSLMDYLIWTQE